MRESWALEALEALRAGDTKRVVDAIKGHAETVTKNGGFGGFRFVASAYIDGESILHLAVRRKDLRTVKALVSLVDVGLRNAEDKTARDLNPKVFDLAYPVNDWSPQAMLAWARSASPHIERREAWLKVFHMSKRLPLDIHSWVQDHLTDLTKAGLEAQALRTESIQWQFALDKLRADEKHLRKLAAKAGYSASS